MVCLTDIKIVRKRVLIYSIYLVGISADNRAGSWSVLYS